MSHTKTPWHVSTPKNTWVSGVLEVRSDVDQPDTTVCVAFNSHDNADANARRIVACVNACDGVPTDVLENTVQRGGALMYQQERRKAAESQRTELLAALTDALAWIDAVPSDMPLPAMPGFDRDEVNNLIAAVKGAM